MEPLDGELALASHRVAMPNLFELFFALLWHVVVIIWPLLVAAVVLAGIVYFVFVRQGGVADGDDQDQ